MGNFKLSVESTLIITKFFYYPPLETVRQHLTVTEEFWAKTITLKKKMIWK